MNNEELRAQLDKAKEFKAAQIAEVKQIIKESENKLSAWEKMIPVDVLEHMSEIEQREAAYTKNKFNKNAIDIAQTYQRFSKKYGHKVVSRQRFGAPIISMAESVIGTYFDWKSVKGVRACIKHELQEIRWRNTLWLLPLNEVRPFRFAPYRDREHIDLLTDSIILTIVAYRIQLNEHHSKLSMLVFSDIVRGLEWLCYWISQGITLDQKYIDVIEVLDVSKTVGYIQK